MADIPRWVIVPESRWQDDEGDWVKYVDAVAWVAQATEQAANALAERDDDSYEQGARDMLATLMSDGSLSVDCPWCFAKTGEPCRLRHGTQAYRTHSDRVKAARRAGKAATVYEQGAKDTADKHHVDRCCSICGTHVMPHRGCILR